MRLQAHDEIKHHHGDSAEQQHRHGVFRPAHLVILVDAGDAINHTLDGPQHRVQERALAVEHPRHENAERLGDGKNQ
jgi:hypothetical protein